MFKQHILTIILLNSVKYYWPSDPFPQNKSLFGVHHDTVTKINLI